MSTSWRVPRRTLAAVVPLATLAGLLSVSPAHAVGAHTGVSVTRDGTGYAIVAETGEVTTFGSVPNLGSPAGFSGKIVDVSVTADGRGYVAVSSRGQVYAYGTARYLGAPASFPGDVADISLSQDGRGYAMVTTTGHVYAYGTVPYRGGATGFTGNVSGISVRPDGQGYVIVAQGGQVYAYNVTYRGNVPGATGGVVDVSVTSSGDGYVAISGAGQVYAFNVPYRGGPTGFTGGIAGVSVTPEGHGYVAVSGIGQRYAFGKVGYGGGPAAGQHQNAYVYVEWGFTPPPVAGITHLDQDVKIGKKAMTTYWAGSWQFTDGTGDDGGYMGLQIDGTRFDGTIGETAIFSVWNATGHRGGTCGTFGGEGSGLSCRRPYPIGTGGTYRYRVVRQEADSLGQWWAAYVRNAATGVETYLGSLRAPAGRGSAISRYVNFSEYFGPAQASPSLVPQSVVDFGQPMANPLTGTVYTATGTYTGQAVGSGTTASVQNLGAAVRVTMGG